MNVYYDHLQTIADHVKCNWCTHRYYTRQGAETCVYCNKKGYLQDIKQDTFLPKGSTVSFIIEDFPEVVFPLIDTGLPKGRIVECFGNSKKGGYENG